MQKQNNHTFEFLHRKHNACTVGTPEKPKMCRIYVGTGSKNGSPPAQIWLKELSRRHPAVEVEAVQRAPLGPITPCTQVRHPHKPQTAEPPKNKNKKRESISADQPSDLTYLRRRVK